MTAFDICDMIKGNESLVENVNFLTPLSHNFKMLHFDANPVFANISKTTPPTSDSLLLIMSHVYSRHND